MKRLKHCKIYLAILLTIIALFLSGCWDSRELDKLSIVSGLGWDIEPDTGEVTLTYQSIIPGEIASSAGNGGGGGGQKGGEPLRTIQLDSDTGSSPYDVLSRYTQHGSRIPFYQHTQVYVFGWDGAEHGIYGFLDTQARNPVARPNVLMVVSEKKASDILGVQDGMESIQAVGMADIIKLSAAFSKYPAITLLEFQNRIMSKTTAPIAPVIGIFEETGVEGEKIKKIRINGTAVFKGDKMIGKLNERQSSGLLWAIDKVEKGYIDIPEASLEIVKAKSRMVPELRDGSIIITIEIDEESNLLEYKGHQDMNPDLISKMEKAQAEEIESQVKAAVQKSFSLNADVFGFGEAVHRKYKKEWKALEPKWDDIYPYLEVAVKVKTHVNEIGDVNKALMKD
ncbi:MAG TPA: Ger(x)C family spore germination protein [Syntrophomonadaceae bacterium]|nr:Ger(x)C family spore germination protein [Syntrophomonadaceae bacterium]HNX28782.1 Ger(x)C family spore germination protein [Syntrophomonadaceae bacterium]HPR92878.1 Ger(x)C family spore germination protein [Syntrophomonadaceae bacterium]